MQRIVMHADLDAFFAQVEQRNRPELKGKPVVVGADPKGGCGRGVVSAASYEARRFGIKSAMPISKAWELCPWAEFLRGDWSSYTQASRAVMTLLKRHAKHFAQVSIDEAFLEVTGYCSDFKQARELAMRIKQEVRERHGLTISIGVGPNKLVSKIAANFRKPDGLTIVDPEGVNEFLNPLPVDALWGIGPKTALALRQMGIYSIEQLAKADRVELVCRFGNRGGVLQFYAKGIDPSPVVSWDGVKSVSRESTFDTNVDDWREAAAQVEWLCQDVHDQLTEQKLFYKNIALKIRFADFETHTTQSVLSHSTDSLRLMQKKALELLGRFSKSDKKIRLLGVRANALTQTSGVMRLTEF